MLPLPREFKARMSGEGLWSALRWLNSGVPYRYSAVFALSGETLHNLCLVDKTDSGVTGCPDQPLTESYCLYVRRFGTSFGVTEARVDSRVTGHPKREAYQCYFGVPLYGRDGKMVGTVCHFDTAPRDLTAGIAETLDEVAPLIAEVVFPK